MGWLVCLFAIALGTLIGIEVGLYPAMRAVRMMTVLAFKGGLRRE
jgi:hypothetical protein